MRETTLTCKIRKAFVSDGRFAEIQHLQSVQVFRQQLDSSVAELNTDIAITTCVSASLSLSLSLSVCLSLCLFNSIDLVVFHIGCKLIMSRVAEAPTAIRGLLKWLSDVYTNLQLSPDVTSTLITTVNQSRLTDSRVRRADTLVDHRLRYRSWGSLMRSRAQALVTAVNARLRYSRLPNDPPLSSCATSTSVELVGIVSLRGPPFIRCTTAIT